MRIGDLGRAPGSRAGRSSCDQFETAKACQNEGCLNWMDAAVNMWTNVGTCVSWRASDNNHAP